MQKRNGFTFIEIIVVLAVVAILVGLALSRADFQRARLDASVQNVGLALGAAQRKATLRQHDMVVTFDQAARRITLHTDMDNDAIQDPGEDVRSIELEEGVVFGRGSAPAASIGVSDVTFTRVLDGLPAVLFHRSGSASEYGGFYLISESGDTEYARAVEITRSTGEVRCHSFRTGDWEPAC